MKSYNLINGNFISLEQDFTNVKSISIQDGKIVAINNPIKNVENRDLNGSYVIPGFIDAHFHIKNYGKRLQQLNFKGVDSLEKIAYMVENKIKQINHGDWILGFGWDQNLFSDKQFPQQNFLNKISPNNPIYFTRIDGHSAWVNDAAIKFTEFEINDFKNINGGDIINNCIVIDNAMNPFKNHLPKESVQQVKDWIKIAIKEIISKGITGVHDAWQDVTTIQAIKELIQENQFPIRCYGMAAGNDKNLLEKFFKNGHYADEYYSIRSVKAFIDGALGSRGAALHEPYCDDKNNCGLILITKEEFNELVQNCYKYNFQLNTHAIGDRGNHFVLNAYGKVLKFNNNRRWRIEHAQMVSDSDLIQFKNHSILPSMQPSHCTSDMKWLPERLGDHRLKLISRWQSFVDLGLKIPGGSDCPIEEGNPLFEFYAAVTRQTHDNWPKEGWQPQEKLNHCNALKMFTTWAAYGGFQENHRGKIAIGYDADLTVLSNDILSSNGQEILDIKIINTIINGKIY